MSPKSFLLDDRLQSYVVAHAPSVDDVERALIEETSAMPNAGMQISADQGAFIGLLATVIGARRAVEVGTFTGYSALRIARALPPAPDGHLLCCDVNAEWTAVGRRYWRAAGVDDRIELRIGPAADTLRALPPHEQFDLAFIDADKEGYRTYYEELLPRMRRDGIILVDNVLWNGRVVDDSADDETTAVIRAFNDHVAADPRVDSVMLTVGDGLTMIRKR